MLNVFNQYINDNFGSKRGLVNTTKYKFMTMLGYFNELTNVNTEQTARLIFVCSGNICRSPLAEYVAKAASCNCESYGLHCRGGDPADPRAVDFGHNMGLDITRHVTRNIASYEYQKGDLLVGMELSHVREIRERFGKEVPATSLMLWGDKKNIYLHDPFNSNDQYFIRCEKNLVQAVKNLIMVIDNGAEFR